MPASAGSSNEPSACRRKRVLVADLEATIIENEMLDELAEFVGMRAQVAGITRRAMNGELDFAAALAQAMKADRLVYLTESGGVWDAERRLIPLVKVKDINRLIRQGVVRDGMIPKLRSCARTMARDVREIDILQPSVPGALLEAFKTGQHAGTRIVIG